MCKTCDKEINTSEKGPNVMWIGTLIDLVQADYLSGILV